jgi:hypothetical protein
MGSFVSKIINLIKTILGGAFKVVSTPGKLIGKSLGSGKLGKGSEAAFNATAVVGGLGTHEKMGEKEISKSLFSNKIKPEFDGI